MASLAIVAIPLPVLGAAPTAEPGPTVQVPEPTDATAPIQRPGSAEAATPTEPAAPTAPAEGTPTDATAPTGSDAPPSSDAVPSDMLDAEPAAPSTTTTATTSTPAPRPAPADPDDELTPNEAITKAYAPRFRPADNPGRFNLAVRGMFAYAGGSKLVGGRMGGIAADVGQTWNHFGYAATATVWGGRMGLQPSSGNEMNAMIGIGPTVGLGRLALLGRGFLDLRVGYDFFYGVVNRRSDTILAQQDDGITVTKAKNLVPHGPRLRLDLGLLSLDTHRRFFHGVGLSMGYQALVGSLNGGLPPAHMITIGIAYWLG